LLRISRLVGGLLEHRHRHRSEREELTRGAHRVLRVRKRHDVPEEPRLDLGVRLKLGDPVEAPIGRLAALELDEIASRSSPDLVARLLITDERAERLARSDELPALPLDATEPEARLVAHRAVDRR